MRKLTVLLCALCCAITVHAQQLHAYLHNQNHKIALATAPPAADGDYLYDVIKPLDNGDFFVAQIVAGSLRWGLVNRSGKVIVPCTLGAISRKHDLYYRLYPEKSNGYDGGIATSDTVIFPPQSTGQVKDGKTFVSYESAPDSVLLWVVPADTIVGPFKYVWVELSGDEETVEAIAFRSDYRRDYRVIDNTGQIVACRMQKDCWSIGELCSDPTICHDETGFWISTQPNRKYPTLRPFRDHYCIYENADSVGVIEAITGKVLWSVDGTYVDAGETRIVVLTKSGTYAMHHYLTGFHQGISGTPESCRIATEGDMYVRAAPSDRSGYLDLVVFDAETNEYSFFGIDTLVSDPDPSDTLMAIVQSQWSDRDQWELSDDGEMPFNSETTLFRWGAFQGIMLNHDRRLVTMDSCRSMIPVTENWFLVNRGDCFSDANTNSYLMQRFSNIANHGSSKNCNSSFFGYVGQSDSSVYLTGYASRVTWNSGTYGVDAAFQNDGTLLDYRKCEPALVNGRAVTWGYDNPRGYFVRDSVTGKVQYYSYVTKLLNNELVCLSGGVHLFYAGKYINLQHLK